jgi:hypothetical protein
MKSSWGCPLLAFLLAAGSASAQPTPQHPSPSQHGSPAMKAPTELDLLRARVAKLEADNAKLRKDQQEIKEILASVSDFLRHYEESSKRPPATPASGADVGAYQGQRLTQQVQYLARSSTSNRRAEGRGFS